MSKKENSTPAAALMMERARTADYGIELGAVAIADSRRRQARGEMLNTHAENLDLRQQNADLQEQNEVLQHQLNEITGLAGTKFIKSEALNDTINHLLKAWEASDPGSAALTEMKNTVDDTYRDRYRKNNVDPKMQQKFNKEVEDAKKKPRARRRPGM